MPSNRLPQLSSFSVILVIGVTWLTGFSLQAQDIRQSGNDLPRGFQPYELESTIFANVRLMVTSEREITIAIDHQGTHAPSGVGVDYVVTYEDLSPLSREAAFWGSAEVAFIRGGIVVTPRDGSERWAFITRSDDASVSLESWLSQRSQDFPIRLFDSGRQIHATDAPTDLILEGLDLAVATQEPADALMNPLFPRLPGVPSGGGGTGGGTGCAQSCSQTCHAGGTCSVSCTSYECAYCTCDSDNHVSCYCN